MKQETLKKIVELAEGFEWEDREGEDYIITIPENNTFLSSWCNHFRTNGWKQIYYPLLIRRAAEGCEHVIIFDNNKRLTCLSLEDDKQTIEYSNYKKTDYLTPQEQAIEACLIEILEDKGEE